MPSSYRSHMASSILKAYGFDQVMNVVGGFDAWQAQGLPFAVGPTREACASS